MKEDGAQAVQIITVTVGPPSGIFKGVLLPLQSVITVLSNFCKMNGTTVDHNGGHANTSPAYNSQNMSAGNATNTDWLFIHIAQRLLG